MIEDLQKLASPGPKGRSTGGIPLDGAEAFLQGWSKLHCPYFNKHSDNAKLWYTRWKLASENTHNDWLDGV